MLLDGYTPEDGDVLIHGQPLAPCCWEMRWLRRSRDQWWDVTCKEDLTVAQQEAFSKNDLDKYFGIHLCRRGLPRYLDEAP